MTSKDRFGSKAEIQTETLLKRPRQRPGKPSSTNHVTPSDGQANFWRRDGCDLPFSEAARPNGCTNL